MLLSLIKYILSLIKYVAKFQLTRSIKIHFKMFFFLVLYIKKKKKMYLCLFKIKVLFKLFSINYN